jgi:hypothetical protein
MRKKGCMLGETRVDMLDACIPNNTIETALLHYHDIICFINDKDWANAGVCIEILKYHPEIKKPIMDKLLKEYGPAKLKKMKQAHEKSADEFGEALYNTGKAILIKKYNLPKNISDEEFKKRLKKLMETNQYEGIGQHEFLEELRSE